MRKIMVLAATALLCSACGSSITVSEAAVVSTSSDMIDSVSVSESTDEEVTTSEDTNSMTVLESDDSSDFGSEFATFQKDQSIEETVLYDENNVVITATGLSYDSYDVTLAVRIENYSDKDLQFLAGTMGYSCNAVNGWMIEDGYLNEEIPSDGSVEETISFGTSELLMHGITEIADIQIGFEIEDADYNRIYTGPLQVKTPLAETYDYNNDGYRRAINSKALQYTYGYTVKAFAEKEAYNSGGIRILSEGYIENQDGERSLFLEMKNDNTFGVYLVLSKINVNGTEIYDSAWSYDRINPNCRTMADIQLDYILDEEEWSEYGIEEIETVGFTIEVTNEDGIMIAEPKELTIGI